MDAAIKMIGWKTDSNPGMDSAPLGRRDGTGPATSGSIAQTGSFCTSFINIYRTAACQLYPLTKCTPGSHVQMREPAALTARDWPRKRASRAVERSELRPIRPFRSSCTRAAARTVAPQPRLKPSRRWRRALGRAGSGASEGARQGAPARTQGARRQLPAGSGQFAKSKPDYRGCRVKPSCDLHKRTPSRRGNLDLPIGLDEDREVCVQRRLA